MPELMAIKKMQQDELAKLAQNVKLPTGINPDSGVADAVLPLIQPFIAQAFGQAKPDEPDFSNFPTQAVPELVRRWMKEDPTREPREQAFLEAVKALVRRNAAAGFHAYEQDLTDPNLAARIDRLAMPFPASDQAMQQFHDDLDTLQTQFLRDLGDGVPDVLAFYSDLGAEKRTDFDETANLYDAAAGIIITPELAPSIHNIAFDYYLSTGQRLHVTSGYRDAHRQAQSAYDHIIGRGAPNGTTDPTLSIYIDRTQAAQIVQAYADAARGGEAAQVDAMAVVIQANFDRGHAISRHMHSQAFDVTFAGVKRKYIEQAAQGNNYTATTDEPGAAPHYHLQAR